MALTTLVLLAAAAGVTAWLSWTFERSRSQAEVERTLRRGSQDIAADLNQLLQETRREARFLAQLPPIQGIVRALDDDGYDEQGGSSLDVWRARLETIFASYLLNDSRLLQVRYLRKDGQELVRVEQGERGVHVVPEEKLQSKAGRRYVEEPLSLGPYGVSVSEINLNREHGEVERPIRPVLRVSVAVPDTSGSPFGVVVLNLGMGEYLRALPDSIPGATVYLTSDAGDYLAHPDIERTFGFDRGRRYRFSDDYERPQGDFFAGGNRSSSSIVPLRSTSGEEYWESSEDVVLQMAPHRNLTVSAVIGDQVVRARMQQSLTRNLSVIGGLGFVLLVLLYLYWSSNENDLQLTNERRLLAEIVDHAQDAIIGVQLDGQVRSWNRAAELMLGYSASEALGQDVGRLIGPYEVDGEAISIRQALARQGLRSAQGAKRWRKDGSSVDVSVTLSPVHGLQGDVVGASMVVRDIAEQKAYQKRIEELNDSLEAQVERRTSQLHEARRSAELASEAKSQFLANMSHEIRTPLAAVQGMLQLLERTPLNDTQRNYASKAQFAARSLLSLINDILDFSKVEAGKFNLDPERFRLDDLLREMGAMISTSIGDKPVDLLFDVEPDVPRAVEADPLRLQQILLNLLSNAVKFTEEGHIIVHVSAKAEGSGSTRLQFSVEDSGMGMSEEQCQRVFRAFEQAEAKTARNFGGTGLGLAISSRLVQLMGGELSVNSTVGVGTTFRFSLVAAIAEFPSSARNRELRDQLRGLSVLIVERNEEARRIQMKLALSLGWTVEVAAEPPKIVESPPADVLLLDARLVSPDVCAQMQQAWPDSVLLLVEPSGCSVPYSASPASYVTLQKPLTGSMLFDAVAKARAPDSSTSDLPTPVDRELRLPGIRALVVDDISVNREIAVALLTSEGADVSAAQNGQECLDLLREDASFDVVLMDVQMPGMDGLEAAQRIRDDLGLVDLPILAMTANALRSDRYACIAAGMNDHVGKPFHIDQLVGTIRKNVSRARDMVETPSTPRELMNVAPERFQFNLALERFGNSRSFFEQQVRFFLDELPRAVEKIADAHRAEDEQALNEAAHALKGSSGMLGMTGLAAACANLEGLANDQGRSAAMQRIEQEAKEGALELLSFVESLSKAPSTRPVEAQLLELARLLAHNDMGAIQAANDLIPSLEESAGDAGADLVDAISRLDFVKAGSLCRELLQTKSTA